MPTLNYGATETAIQHHYDVSDEFYALWLDDGLSYSCAMWEPGDSLEQAQKRKIDYHLDNIKARSCKTLLDIGCGWGGMLERSVKHFGVQSAIGLTMSNTQANHVAHRAIPGVTVYETKWQDFKPAREFDGIISVGAFEHFAKPSLSNAEMIQAYEEFFERCRLWVKPGGYMSLQTIGYGSARRKDINQFILNDIFPESDLPNLTQIIKALEHKFEVISVRNDRQDYAETFRVWTTRLRREKSQAVKLVGEEHVARYLKYQGMFAVGFHTGAMTLYRLQLRRER